ncbi:hypothetical protein TraAM80_06979 [Trypanosoma rangeli]|uniref:Uncharacterized protein n=1 Tax=Trypanosoma rangeli TaxID=5698 RepID=A0A422N7L0_TRYRA|nr:uncharacterized protein TraAM80_06979 [Trypanosoma rangeli]RNF01416.1 hypothetical protein TraAM80_06979 [Trypanosoma rangeli]|eukprot:RNF01416.1 hypothetical protein TraAM80_06979 [Trypanosoma rangeli]
MPYIPTGKDRDSYISGVRPGCKFGAMHDVSKRRDNLPEHVFAPIRDQVIQEERLRLVDEEARANVRLQLFSGKKGKRMAGGADGDERQELERVENVESVRARHRALLELYSVEREQWRMELEKRGLTMEM